MRGYNDLALGYFHGGVPGRLEAIGGVVKKPGGSLFAFFMRLTDMEQRAISVAKAKGLLLNTLDTASMGLDSRHAQAAGMQGAVEGGLQSAKTATTPEGAREAWRPELQALALAWQDSLETQWGCTADDDAEEAEADSEDKEDRALRLMIIYMRECCVSQADVEEEELRAVLAQQASYEGMRAHRAAAQMLGLGKGGHMDVALAGKKKKDLPSLTADDKEDVQVGAHAARSKGQAKQRVVLENRVAADPTQFTSAWHQKQSTGATAGRAKNNKGEGHKGVSHFYMIPTASYRAMTKQHSTPDGHPAPQALRPTAQPAAHPRTPAPTSSSPSPP